jgi:hypothetical protein
MTKKETRISRLRRRIAELESLHKALQNGLYFTWNELEKAKVEWEKVNAKD